MPQPLQVWRARILLAIEAIRASFNGLQVTEDGEIWTTVTERENDVWISYNEKAIAATKYIILVDLDNAQFPHRIQGQPINRVDLTSIYFSTDLSASGQVELGYGTISRVGALNADIHFFTGIPLLSGASQEDQIVSLRGVPSQVKLDMATGVLQHGLSNMRETNVAAVNTGALLDSPLGAGTVHPAVGDVILKVTRTAGTLNFGTFLFYHTH